MFQYHLFLNLFNINEVAEVSLGILVWILFVAIIIISLETLDLPLKIKLKIKVLIYSTTLVSFISLFYTQVPEANINIILIAFHRSSILITQLFFALLALIIITRIKDLSIFILLSLLLLIHIGLIVISIPFYVLKLMQLFLVQKTSLPDKIYILSLFLLILYVGICGCILFFSSYPLGRGTNLVVLILAILVLVFIPSIGSKMSTNKFWKSFNLKFFSIILLIIGLILKLNIYVISRPVNDDFFEIQNWVRFNTPVYTKLFIPLDDKYFGWTSFSLRANSGQPRTWLHYAILYSRSTSNIEYGRNLVDKFGVDLDGYLQNPFSSINRDMGKKILSEITINYEKLQISEIMEIVNNLGYDFLIVRNNYKLDPCFQSVFKNKSYVIYKSQNNCKLKMNN
jgi:hypothetical protein